MRKKTIGTLFILSLILLIALGILTGLFPSLWQAVATPTPTPTVDADATMLASLPTVPPAVPTLPEPVALTGWHVIFQQQGSAKAGVTTQKILGDITISQAFMLEVACIGSGSVQAQIGSWGKYSGLCPRDPGFAANTEVPPASFTRYPVSIEVQGPVQWEVVVQEKD